MKTLVAFVATRVISDRTDNRVSVIDWVDDFTAQGFPIVFPRVAAIWLIEREAGDEEGGTGTLSIFINNVFISSSAVEFNFGGQRRARAVTNIIGLSSIAPGEIEFRFVPPGKENLDFKYSFLISGQPQAVTGQVSQTGTVTI